MNIFNKNYETDALRNPNQEKMIDLKIDNISKDR